MINTIRVLPGAASAFAVFLAASVQGADPAAQQADPAARQQVVTPTVIPT